MSWWGIHSQSNLKPVGIAGGLTRHHSQRFPILGDFFLHVWIGWIFRSQGVEDIQRFLMASQGAKATGDAPVGNVDLFGLVQLLTLGEGFLKEGQSGIELEMVVVVPGEIVKERGCPSSGTRIGGGSRKVECLMVISERLVVTCDKGQHVQGVYLQRIQAAIPGHVERRDELRQGIYGVAG